VYATVADLRGEDVSLAQATDARVLTLIDEASRSIDRATGWFFEPRLLTVHLEGRGTPTIELRYPPIRLDKLSIGSLVLSLDPRDLVVVGAPVEPGFDGPRVSLRHGRVFPRRDGTLPRSGIYASASLIGIDDTITAEGLWGYTEPDGTPTGRTPLEIRRACILLVLRGLAPLGDDGAWDARNRWRLVEERTRDQSYKLAPNDAFGVLTGDPEADRILWRFRRPAGLGAT
jgi:hypothetical protein